jgi:hypothetical protein
MAENDNDVGQYGDCWWHLVAPSVQVSSEDVRDYVTGWQMRSANEQKYGTFRRISEVAEFPTVKRDLDGPLARDVLNRSWKCFDHGRELAYHSGTS